MKKIVYTVKDELGIHVSPAGLLVKEIQKYESDVAIDKERQERQRTQADGSDGSWRQVRGNNQRNGGRFRRGIRRRRN